MEADFTITELGTFDSADADRLFRNHDWSQRLAQAEAWEAELRSVASPDLTFTALPAHLVVTAESPDRFSVEVCLPRSTKLFGVFRLARFYMFQCQNMDAVSQIIHTFCGENLEMKHSSFRAMQRLQS